MSFRNLQQNTIAQRGVLNSNGTYIAGQWVRNPSWLALPSISYSDEKFAGLHRVDENSAFASIQLSVSSGTYTVDWGDGTAPQTYTSNTVASYQYTYGASGLNGTNGPVTFTDSGDTVNRTAHGYTDGMNISFASITTTTGITVGQTYYVVNATPNTFQVASTVGGSALPLTTDGSGVILPYKQAVIQAYPTTGGQTITKIWTYVPNATAGLNVYTLGWLDIATASSATEVQFSGFIGQNQSTQLQQGNVIRCATTTFAKMFCYCYQMSNIVQVVSTATVTDCQYMFFSCTLMQSAPLVSTGSSTNFTQMFGECVNLKAVPLLDTSAGTDFALMFQACRTLTTVPLFNLSSALTLTQMFVNCSGLQSVPLFNIASATSVQQMFQFCIALTSIPLFNTASVTNMQGWFSSCSVLQTVPLFNTAAVTDMSSMFSNCSALQTVPLFNTASVTNMQNMFNRCVSLSYVPPLVTTANQEKTSMFAGCISLSEIPPISGAAIINSSSMSNFMNNDASVSKMGITGIKYSFSVATAKLSGTQLDAIYTNLATVGGSVTFTDDGDLVTKTDHGYLNGQTVVFASVTTTTGITAGYTYYVINQTANTFQVASSSGDAALPLTTNGTGTIAAATITVSNNYGTSSDTPSIATAKGWTVTGS